VIFEILSLAAQKNIKHRWEIPEVNGALGKSFMVDFPVPHLIFWKVRLP
jgi:hypothetical protein